METNNINDKILSESSQLRQWKNSYEGERAFIIGNGPSLNESPLEELNNEYTFAVNKINKIYEETSWRPSFFFSATPPSSDSFPQPNSEDDPIRFHSEAGIACFLTHQSFNFYGESDNIYYFNKFKLTNNKNPFHQMTNEAIKTADTDILLDFWSEDASNMLYSYHTLYPLTQLVIYMGFDEIFYIGADLGMGYKNPHIVFEDAMDPYRYDGDKYDYFRSSIESSTTIKSIINGILMKTIQNNFTNRILTRVISASDTPHFDSEYHENLEIWDGPKYEKEIIKSHIAIKKLAEHYNVDVYNATVGGELEVYQRVNIEDIID